MWAAENSLATIAESILAIAACLDIVIIEQKKLILTHWIDNPPQFLGKYVQGYET